MSMNENTVNILSSATAGVVGRLICHPIDTIKSKIQANDSFRGVSDVVRTTLRQEGLVGLYRGLSATALGSAPGVCVYLSTYEYCRDSLSHSTGFGNSPTLAYLASGMIAEAACCSIFIPIDVVKERLQVQSMGQKYHYSGSLDAFRTILRTEGLHGLYKGYFVTLFSYGPFSALYFSIYETMKEKMGKSEKGELTFLESLFSSAVAGGVASFATNPFEIAKLRYQIQAGNVPAGRFRVAEIMKEIYFKNGVKGLFRGSLTRLLFHTPSTAITMAMYEECKKLWTQILLSK